MSKTDLERLRYLNTQVWQRPLTEEEGAERYVLQVAFDDWEDARADRARYLDDYRTYGG